MSGKQFFYKRWEERVIKGEKVVVEFPESFNIDHVLLSRWLDDEYCIWLHDGHEQAMPIEVPQGVKVVNADKLKPMKSREWVITQIMLRGPDIARFRKASELVVEIDEKSDSFTSAQPRIIHIPKTEVKVEDIPKEEIPLTDEAKKAMEEFEGVKEPEGKIVNMGAEQPKEEERTKDELS